MKTSVGINLARSIFSVIDKAIYSLIAAIYNIIEELASNVSVFNESTIDDFAKRIYVFIGIVMVFKVTFSLINYLVNPDSMNDKNSGVGNVAKNIVITLVLLIITPYAFDFLYRAQNAILSDNILPQVILGTSDTKSVSQKFQMAEDCEVVEIDDPGQFMALVALRPFYGVNKGASIESIKDEYCNANYTASDMLTESIYNAEDNDMYIIDYSFFMSTVSGVIVLVLMLTIGMDIALRIIKLGFLEIIAPVPIISYVDPKSGKDGIFKKWLKEVIRTWISLFLKLAVLYFAIYIIKVLDDALVNVSNHNYDMWISLFLLIGALMFAKQFTKLIEDIFGVKLDGMSLHPIKKIQEQAIGGKAIASAITGTGAALGVGAVAAVGAGAANVFNNRRHKMDGQFTLKNNIKSFGSGMLYGAYHGMKNGYATGKDGKLKLGANTINSIKSASSDRNLNEALVKQGASKAPFAKARFMYEDWKTDLMGYQGKGGSTDELKEELKRLERQKELSEVKYNNAIETSSRILATAPTQLRDALNKYNPLNIDYKTDGNGNIVLNSDGQVEWKLDKLVSYEDFMRSHGNEFKFENESQKEQFRVAYQSLYNASTDYRESYNSMVDADKKQTKLEKEKAKFEATKKTAK